MFIWSALAHLIALTSPGPDTAIVIRQTSIYGRKEGFKAALGIGVGIYAHCLLAINGISLIILSNDLYKFIISIVGGTYIAYLGISMYFNNNSSSEINNTNTKTKNSFTIGYYFPWVSALCELDCWQRNNFVYLVGVHAISSSTGGTNLS